MNDIQHIPIYSSDLFYFHFCLLFQFSSYFRCQYDWHLSCLFILFWLSLIFAIKSCPGFVDTISNIETLSSEIKTITWWTVGEYWFIFLLLEWSIHILQFFWFMPRYSWYTAKFGVKQPINQSINHFIFSFQLICMGSLHFIIIFIFQMICMGNLHFHPVYMKY